MTDYTGLRGKAINNVLCTFGDFTKRLGLGLLGLMPLVSLTNVWEVTNFKGLHIRLIDLLFILLWYIWIHHVFLHGTVRRDVILFLGLVTIFFLISFLGSVFLPQYQVQWPALFRFAQTLLWGGLALAFVRSDRGLKVIVRNVIIVGIVLSLYSLYLYCTEPGLHRIAGFFSTAGGAGFGRQASFNEIGALYALADVLSLNYLFWGNRGVQRWKSVMPIIGFLLNTLGLVLVQSRSAFLAFTIGSFVLFFPHLKRLLISGKIGKKAIIFGIGILIGSIVIIISSSYLVTVNRISRTFLPGSSEYISASTRVVLWHKTIGQIMTSGMPYFLVGYGFRSSIRLIGAASSHNFFLNIGLWLGLAGLVLTIILLIWPIIKVKRETGGQMVIDAAVAAISVALTVSMFGNTLADPFYGGCTFLISYGSVAASLSSRSEVK